MPACPRIPLPIPARRPIIVGLGASAPATAGLTPGGSVGPTKAGRCAATLARVLRIAGLVTPAPGR